MNDWSQRRRQKELEKRHLNHFLDSYFHATGERLQIHEITERPDFLCKRENGTTVGVELTQIVRNPNDAEWEKILEGRQFMTLEEALECIQNQTLRKDKKRSEDDWKLSGRTILVLQLMDIPLWKVGSMLSDEMLPDLQETKFSEIWMADFTTIEAFGEVELYAFYHPELGGNQLLLDYKKPYG